MAQLIPTPVTISALQDISSNINSMNTGQAQVLRPRTRAFDLITVEVTDDPHGTPGYWNQSQLTGEWVRTCKGAKLGNAAIASGIDWVITPS